MPLTPSITLQSNSGNSVNNSIVTSSSQQQPLQIQPKPMVTILQQNTVTTNNQQRLLNNAQFAFQQSNNHYLTQQRNGQTLTSNLAQINANNGSFTLTLAPIAAKPASTNVSTQNIQISHDHPIISSPSSTNYQPIQIRPTNAPNVITKPNTIVQSSIIPNSVSNLTNNNHNISSSNANTQNNAAVTSSMSNNFYREWILEAIDKLRERKARPDADRISTLMKRYHNVPLEETVMCLSKLADSGDVVCVDYKGNISYRNPCKWRKNSANGGGIINPPSITQRLLEAFKYLDKVNGSNSTTVVGENGSSTMSTQKTGYVLVDIESAIAATTTPGSMELNKAQLRHYIERESNYGKLARRPDGTYIIDENGEKKIRKPPIQAKKTQIVHKPIIKQNIAAAPNFPGGNQTANILSNLNAGSGTNLHHNVTQSAHIINIPNSNSYATFSVQPIQQYHQQAAHQLNSFVPTTGFPTSVSFAPVSNHLPNTILPKQTLPNNNNNNNHNQPSSIAFIKYEPTNNEQMIANSIAANNNNNNNNASINLSFIPSTNTQFQIQNPTICTQSVEQLPQPQLHNSCIITTAPVSSSSAASTTTSQVSIIDLKKPSDIIKPTQEPSHSNPIHNINQQQNSFYSTASSLLQAAANNKANRRGRPPGSKNKRMDGSLNLSNSSSCEFQSTPFFCKRTKFENEPSISMESSCSVQSVTTSDQTVPAVGSIVDLCSECKLPQTEFEKFLYCKDCPIKVHPSCLHYWPELTERARQSLWQCSACKTCTICNDKSSKESVYICDGCDKGFHANCHEPKIQEPISQNSAWICSNCYNEGFRIKSEGVGADYKKDSTEVKSTSGNALKTNSFNSNDNSKIKIKLENSASEPVFNNNGKENQFNKSTPQLQTNAHDTSTTNIVRADDVTQWSVDDVCQWLCDEGFTSQSNSFREQEIDGACLLLMKRIDVLTELNIKLGPAVKIYEKIKKIQNDGALFKVDDDNCF